MVSSIAIVICIAFVAFLHIVLRDRPFSEDFELNPIYHSPPPGMPPRVKLHEGVILTIKEIRRTMQLATILAKPDYELAKNYQKYEKILNFRTEDIEE